MGSLDHERRTTIINKKHRHKQISLKGYFDFLFTHTNLHTSSVQRTKSSIQTQVLNAHVYIQSLLVLKLKRSLGQEQTRQAKRRVVLPDLHMNGEEDERERTRRVETEHDRDEFGVGVAGSGRLQPSSPGGLYQLQ